MDNASLDTGQRTAQPIDAVAERLNDPGVAASLVTLLDNAELLSTLVLGLSGLMERGDMIMDAVAEGVNDFKASGTSATGSFPEVADLGNVVGQLTKGAPTIGALLDSPVAQPETIALLGEVAEATSEGIEAARRNGTSIDGVRGMYKAMKDPEVQRGLGLLLEVSRALGRRFR